MIKLEKKALLIAERKPILENKTKTVQKLSQIQEDLQQKYEETVRSKKKSDEELIEHRTTQKDIEEAIVTLKDRRNSLASQIPSYNYLDELKLKQNKAAEDKQRYETDIKEKKEKLDVTENELSSTKKEAEERTIEREKLFSQKKELQDKVKELEDIEDRETLSAEIDDLKKEKQKLTDNIDNRKREEKSLQSSLIETGRAIEEEKHFESTAEERLEELKEQNRKGLNRVSGIMVHTIKEGHKKTAAFVFLMFLITGYADIALAASTSHYAIRMPLDAIFLIVTGVFIGILGTLIGAGGGFLHVPMLMILYGFSPQHAIGTSMAVVFLNTLSGTFAYVTHKRIDYELGIKFSVFAVPGVMMGAFLAQKFNVLFFSLFFALLLIFLAYILIFVREFSLVRMKDTSTPKTRVFDDALGQRHSYAPDVSIGYAGCFLIGIISGLFGIGGGLLHVPLMNFLGIPIHIATATSHLMIVITSFFGSITFIGLNSIDLNYAIFLGVGTILGAYYGAKIAALTSSDVIKKILALTLVLVAVKLIIGVI